MTKQMIDHWFVLIQSAPLPETLIGNSSEFLLRGRFAGLISRPSRRKPALNICALSKIPPPSTRASEDYRAGASVDLEHDTADARKIACPVLALWAAQGNTERMFDVIATWHARRHESDGQSPPRTPLPSRGGAGTNAGGVAGVSDRVSTRLLRRTFHLN